MKYCRTCKTRAADSETVCAKCGALLTTLGAAQAPAGGAAAGGAAAPQLSLQGQIRELQAARTSNLRRSKVLALLAAGLLLAILLTLYELYSRAVLSYAVLDNVTIEQDPSAEQLVRIAFDVVKPGRVAYDRRSGGRRTEKIDEFSHTGRQHLAWAWPSSTDTGIEFRVVFRRGLSRSSVDRHFDYSGRHTGGAVDVVFLLDTTGSMEPYILALQKRCIEFAGVVRDQGHDCRLGLIGFGDIDAGEPIHVFEPTGQLQEFQSAVAQVPRTRGGDDPESAVDAIRRALQLPLRDRAAVCLVLITDESCHHPEELPALAEALEGRGVVMYVVSRRRNANLYSPLCVGGGKFFPFEEARFDEILLGVAKSLSNQIRYR
ncbi:MAG: vWA domain-containing protein [Planctomycetaceae bacterium]